MRGVQALNHESAKYRLGRIFRFQTSGAAVHSHRTGKQVFIYKGFLEQTQKSTFIVGWPPSHKRLSVSSLVFPSTATAGGNPTGIQEQ
ncbi:hypothetical protein AB6A40_009284 [Gnathostoma spinigerum]|uniref:Uncharacterized protein n=1 Tax=Gnathostoma spinigerum TaxID=75299 RepID=A0ABD6F1C2_9BILA